MSEKSRLRKTISKWASTSEAHARELREEHAATGVSIEEAPDRELIELQGQLRTVTLRPRGGVPALEADLYDGTGILTLVWLGRRQIAGIEPGRVVRVRGRIGRHDGHRVLYNPRYELLP